MNTFLKDNRRSLKKNIEFYFGRLIGFPLTTPEHVYFSLTNRCNLQCRMCDIYKNPDSKENEQSTSEVKAIIAQIKNMSINHIIFSGGEPLLRHDVLDLVEFAVAKGIGMVDIITNGTLLKDKSIKKIIKSKLNHITISLDGLGKINDEIRGKGVFEKAQLNMDKLNYYKAKYAAEFPTVGINFTIMNNNLEHILPIIEFARAKKCNILVLQPLLFDNTNMQEKRTNFLWPAEDKIDRLREIMKEVMKKKNQLNDLFIYTDEAILKAMPDYFKGHRASPNFKCYEGIKRIVITADAKVWSCLGVYGDLKKHALKKIWFSPAAWKIRRRANQCREHCLQDCVYFPIDVLKDIKNFIHQILNNRRQ